MGKREYPGVTNTDRTIAEIKQAENSRLNSVIDDRGIDAAVAFAKQGYQVYRSSRKQRPCKYGKEYRTELIVSCIVYRQFIRNFG